MKKSMIIGLLILSARSDAALQSIELFQPYMNGKSVCSIKADPPEFGSFVNVPVNYKDLSQGTTSIYFWTFEKMNPQLPTVIVFNGGPGNTSHLKPFEVVHRLPRQWNVIYFDQRGVACSRPDQFELLRDPAFFSSENTARDAEEIRKSLGLDKVSVLGGSYGTLPVTIYAHLYSQSTRAAVLWGTVVDGARLDDHPYSLEQLQTFYDQSPEWIKTAIIADPDTFAAWFSPFVHKKSGENFTFFEMRDAMDRVATRYGKTEFSRQMKGYYDGTKDLWPKEDNIVGRSVWTALQLYCQEVPRYNNLIGIDPQTGKLKYVTNNKFNKFCSEQGVPQKKLFNALNYKIKSPVTYFHGEEDVPRPLRGEFSVEAHFKNVPQGAAQLLTAPEGGHQILSSGFGSSIGAILEAALEGKMITQAQIDKSNAESKIKFSATYRGFTTSLCDEVHTHWRSTCGAFANDPHPDFHHGVNQCLDLNFTRELKENRELREKCVPQRAPWPGGIVGLYARPVGAR